MDFRRNEEVGGSDPHWISNSTPATYDNFTSGLLPLPELNLSHQRLTFLDFTYPSRGPPPIVSVLNLGGGTLAPQVSDNASWLNTTLVATPGLASLTSHPKVR